MSSNLYSQGFGTTSSSSFPGNAIVTNRAPTSSDIQGVLGRNPVGQLWVDTTTETSWQLVNYDISNGLITAAWTVLGGGGAALATLSGDTGIASPVGGNIQILGGAGIVTTAGGDTVTIALTGGDPAIDSINVDAFTAPGTNPVIPDVNGEITVTGGQIAAGSTANVIRTNSLANNTYTIEIQRAEAAISTSVASNGVSHFNSNQFSVDSNGFVSLAGGGQAIDSVGVDSNIAPGTDPVLPDSNGLINITGGQIATGSTANVIRTQSIAANEITVQVQRSTASATTTVANNGVCHFNSAQFSVDGNGFVELAGGGLAIDSIGVQTGTNPITPTAGGLVTINGAVVAAGTNPVRTDGTGADTMAVEVQISQAIAATDATKIGLSNFNSAHFSVDANGFVELSGGGQAIDSFIPDSGTSPVVPAANGSVTMSGSGSITTVGGLNSLTTQLTGLTNHNVLVGAGTTTITNVAPSATSGIPLVSNGAAADPSFTTAVVEGGGTGNTTFTAYSVICAGTTATGAFQNVSGLGSSGQVLTSNGAAALPTWQTNAGGDVVGPASSTDNAFVRFDGLTGKLIKNGVTTEDNTGNISQSASVSGASLSILTSNTSNTASSTAFHQVQVAGSTASDAYYEANISGGQAWTFGLDNSDSDSFVISASATPGTTNIMRASTAGEINYPLQPAFLAYNSATDTNVTGDSTVYTIICDTEIYDQGSDYNNVTGTFTCPVTARVSLTMAVFFTGGTAITSGTVQFVTSNRTYRIDPWAFTAAASVTGCSGCWTINADMDAADTVTFTVSLADTGGKVDDLYGGASPLATFVSGYIFA